MRSMSSYPAFSGPAHVLDDLYKTLRPGPLMDAEEFRLYYRGEVNKVRGEDTVARLSLKLQQAYGAVPFKAFLMGHPGVGKSTEVSRLLERVKDQHAGVRLNIASELNPASFKVFDVLLLMMARLAEGADEAKAGPVGGIPSRLVSDIEQWFGPEMVKRTRTESAAVGVEAGAGVKGDSLWAGVLGLFASAKAEMKYASDRKTELVEYRLQRLSDLVDICNRMIDLCSRSMFEKTGKEWLLIIEDLDKTGISPQQLQELFIQYGNVFQDLRVNMIFTIPVWLAYSPDANRLPYFERFMINDTPVYMRDHEPHQAGRAAVQAVLEARVSQAVFAAGQMTRLIVASGGNLRDLFALVLDAGEGARAKNSKARTIGPDDATAAINKMRRDYRMKLGQSPYDTDPIPYSEKSERLVAVYKKPDNEIPDRVLYSLLRGRALQEFNGTGWYAVHPLVVDVLKEQGHLAPDAPGGTE